MEAIKIEKLYKNTYHSQNKSQTNKNMKIVNKDISFREVFIKELNKVGIKNGNDRVVL